LFLHQYFDGELAVTGSASMGMKVQYGGANLHEATAFTMANQLTFTRSAEKEKGMTV
jgi:hypothetical protein